MTYKQHPPLNTHVIIYAQEHNIYTRVQEFPGTPSAQPISPVLPPTHHLLLPGPLHVPQQQPPHGLVPLRQPHVELGKQPLQAAGGPVAQRAHSGGEEPAPAPTQQTYTSQAGRHVRILNGRTMHTYIRLHRPEACTQRGGWEGYLGQRRRQGAGSPLSGPRHGRHVADVLPTIDVCEEVAGGHAQAGDQVAAVRQLLGLLVAGGRLRAAAVTGRGRAGEMGGGWVRGQGLA